MSDSQVFMMGEFPAEFPNDRQYAKNHMWALPVSQHTYRFGFTAYAVRLLQDVYFLDWIVDAPSQLLPQQTIGAIESSKAESDLYAPLEGKLIQFNETLLSAPALINVDMYHQGWLFEFEGSGDELLSLTEYIEHLTAVWEVAQRTIKGQLA